VVGAVGDGVSYNSVSRKVDAVKDNLEIEIGDKVKVEGIDGFGWVNELSWTPTDGNFAGIIVFDEKQGVVTLKVPLDKIKKG
jgi:hypothetical protein